MVNDLLSTFGPRIKFVDDLKVLEIAPGSSPSYIPHIVSDIRLFACHNNIKLNPEKFKEMIDNVDFLQYNATNSLIAPYLYER